MGILTNHLKLRMDPQLRNDFEGAVHSEIEALAIAEQEMHDSYEKGEDMGCPHMKKTFVAMMDRYTAWREQAEKCEKVMKAWLDKRQSKGHNILAYPSKDNEQEECIVIEDDEIKDDKRSKDVMFGENDTGFEPSWKRRKDQQESWQRARQDSR